MITKEMIEAAAKAIEQLSRDTDALPYDAARDYAVAALTAALSVQWRGMESAPSELITSETDEALMRQNLLQCYGTKTMAFRVSKEHYRYLAEQIVSLRQIIKRNGMPLPPPPASKE